MKQAVLELNYLLRGDTVRLGPCCYMVVGHTVCNSVSTFSGGQTLRKWIRQWPAG